MRLILYIFGFAILISGYGSAALVWRAQDRIEAAQPDDAPLPLADSRKDSQQLEIVEGKTGLLFERWTEWLDGFLHGRTLAKTLVVVSSVAAIGCFIAAAHWPFQFRPAPSNEE